VKKASKLLRNFNRRQYSIPSAFWQNKSMLHHLNKSPHLKMPRWGCAMARTTFMRFRRLHVRTRLLQSPPPRRLPMNAEMLPFLSLPHFSPVHSPRHYPHWNHSPLKLCGGKPLVVSSELPTLLHLASIVTVACHTNFVPLRTENTVGSLHTQVQAKFTVARLTRYLWHREPPNRVIGDLGWERKS